VKRYLEEMAFQFKKIHIDIKFICYNSNSFEEAKISSRKDFLVNYFKLAFETKILIWLKIMSDDTMESADTAQDNISDSTTYVYLKVVLSSFILFYVFNTSMIGSNWVNKFLLIRFRFIVLKPKLERPLHTTVAFHYCFC